ncbi:MAG: ROK family protein [Proteobacteria bacterium]|nr:ROK family protein [Pseudomonadota bacterium]
MRIGIDIGGTKILVGVVDETGSIIYKIKIPTDAKNSYICVRDDIVNTVDNVLKECGLHKKDIGRIGIASAGQIDKKTHNVVFSPNLGWHNVPLKQDFEKIFGIETFIENDVNAATYGEWKFGLNSAPDDVVGVFIGTGIGGGLIINRKLYRGFTNVGGELGHITVNPYGYKCNCGNHGCLEAYCGGSYIVGRVQEKIKSGYRGRIWDIIGGNVDILHTGHIEEACLSGDEFCVYAWREVIEYMGAAMASIANLINPEVIILGGGVVYGTRYFVDDIRDVMEKRAMPASIRGLKIEKAKLGEDSAIMGAVFTEA